jgi:hypothetical protein
VANDNRTVKIKPSDANAKAVIKVDKKEISVAGLGKPLRLRVGDH